MDCSDMPVHQSGQNFMGYLWRFVDELVWDVNLLKAYAQAFLIDLSMCGILIYLMYRSEIHGSNSQSQVGVVSFESEVKPHEDNRHFQSGDTFYSLWSECISSRNCCSLVEGFRFLWKVENS